VRVIDHVIYVNPVAQPLRTRSDGVPCITPPVAGNLPGEFYIGWEEKSPLSLAQHTRKIVLVLAVAVPTLLSAVAWVQNPVDEGTFEFGHERTFTGVLRESPLPMLQVLPNGVSDVSGGMNLLLVGAGKFGAPSMLHGHEGQLVQLTGSLIYRRGQVMLEVNQLKSFAVLRPAAKPQEDAPISLGSVNLVGELVDTKCFFGVMRPAVGKIHQGCAILCLSGGVPPGLLVRDDDGTGVVILLAGSAGRPLAFDPAWAAQRLRASGELELYHGTPVLRAKSLELVEP
jgi:hypothetical protein